MRFHTQECRWFFEGPAPGAVVEWFEDARPWERSAGIARLAWPRHWRVDRYLIFPGRDDMGLKLRLEPGAPPESARIEVKGRAAELGLDDFGRAMRGRVDHWVKWSFEPAAGPTGLSQVLEGAGSCAVSKKRLLRRAWPQGQDTALELPLTNVRFSRGMSVELTRIRVEAQIWWTLGFEAHPCDQVLRDPFHDQVALFLADFPEPGLLSAARSWAYPTWLKRLS